MAKGYAFALFILLLCVSAGILLDGQVPWEEVLAGAKLRLSGHTTAWNPLLDERLPRLIVLVSSGAALAVSGAVMQSLFHNPLASPGILGITAGGSLLVLFVFILGWHAAYPLSTPLAAIAGSFLTLLLVYNLSKSKGRSQVYSLVLTGIAISTIFIAIQSAIIYCFRDNWTLIQILTEWQAGSTYNRNWQHVHMQLPLLIVGLSGCMIYRRELNILSLGEEEAANIGVDVKRIRWRLFLCVALLAGGALATTGTIAFFGLILPHLVRALNGPNHKSLIPYSMLGGAFTLPALDLILRTFHLHFITIGNISAILGGLFFFTLLYQSRKDDSKLRRSYA